MPNHVKTVVRFKNLKNKEDVDLIVNTITSRLDRDPMKQVIDFDKITPEPKTIEDCSPRYIIPEEKRGHSGLAVTDGKDWFNWYDWHIDHWGTKWNAYDSYTKIGVTQVTFVFSTAWSPAIPVIQKLGLLGYDIDVRYADEDIGSNCGMMTYTNKNGWDYYSEAEIAHPEQFARNLWNRY